MKKISLYIYFTLCFFSSIAQQPFAKASVDRNKIVIGEPIKLELQSTVPSRSAIKWFSTDTIPHFEFIEKGKIDSSEEGNYKQILTITSFDSGQWVIPAFTLQLNGKSYYTDSIPVTISFTDVDPNQDYRDIKDIIEVDNPYKNYLNWILAAVGLLLFAFLIFYLRKNYRRKKPAMPAETFSHLSPLEEALQALDSLQKKMLDEKELYTTLNNIIRWFVYRKTSIRTMQKTNGEFIAQIEKLGLGHDEFISLSQTLRLFDVVKFAKFIPDEAEKQRSFKIIRSSIQLINNPVK